MPRVLPNPNQGNDDVNLQAKAEPEVIQKAQANAYDNFAVWLRGKPKTVMAQRIDQNVLFEALAQQ